MSEAALTISQEPPQPASIAAAAVYDAFISYSHAKDKALAAALQAAMQRLGKPWYRRRALRLFRDDTSLTATPHLWPSIEKALGQSRFLILMASPEAAASRWVNQELAWWLEHKGADTVLIALTSGELDWDSETGDFRSGEATPLPPALAGTFADEPLWIDLRPYRETASPRDARFTDLAASIAAALHGRAKEDLLSLEVRQQRRALRLAGSAVVLLLVLLGLAGWQWNTARIQRDRAEHNLALATQTANKLVYDLAQKFRNSGLPIALVSDILNRAHQLQDQLTSSGEVSAALRDSEAAALLETGLTLVGSGDAKGALAADKQAHDILQSLLTDTPQNTHYRQELSASDFQIGYALLDQGDITGALASYREGKAIVSALAQEEPGNAEWQQGLAAIDHAIGDALQPQGDLTGALSSYRQALAITTELAKAEPGNAEWQRNLAIVNGLIGDVLKAQGDLAGAETAYRTGLTISQTLAKSDPGNTRAQYDLANMDDRLGGILSAHGDLAGAFAAYSDALTICKALAKADPDNGDWQRILNRADNAIGAIDEKNGNLADALAAYREALSVAKALAQKDANNLEWQRAPLVSDIHIGNVLEAQGDLSNALASYRDALAIAQNLAGKNPALTEWQHDIWVSDDNIAHVLQAQGDFAGALAAFRDNLSIARAITQAEPGKVQWRQEFISLLQRIAQAQVDNGDAAGAVTTDQELVEIERGSYGANQSGDARRQLAEALGDLSWLQLLNNNPQASLKNVDEALALDLAPLFLQENRANALLLLGRVDEAKAIYLANKDKPLNGKSFADVVREDFAQLRKFGIDTPDMKQVEDLLAS